MANAREWQKADIHRPGVGGFSMLFPTFLFNMSFLKQAQCFPRSRQTGVRGQQMAPPHLLWHRRNRLLRRTFYEIIETAKLRRTFYGTVDMTPSHLLWRRRNLL